MDGNRLTDDWLETGLARLEEEGLSASTLHQYRGYLRLFQQFLGQTKELGPKSLAQWQQAMAQEGVLSNSSINTRISAGNSLLRALGDSRTPVIFLVVASLLNIALDLFLIVVIPMGVAGAAWATVISQGISGLACLVFIWKKFPLLHISRDDLVFRKDYARRLLGMGIPMGLQSSITAIGSILLQTSVNGLGSVVVASITAANKLYQLFSCVFDALGVAMSTYGGQNIGARPGDRIFAGLRAGMIIGSVYSLFSLVVVVFFGKPMTLLFVDASETVIIDQAYQFMVIQVAFFIPLTAVNVIRLLIQGMGYSKLAVFAGVFEMIARGGFGLFLVPVFGFNMACFASPAAWILADCFLIPAYRKVMRHVRQYGQ